MILLREPGLLFLKPHKVAGTSFEIALSAFAGPDDIITPLGRRGREDEAVRRAAGFPGPRNYRWPLHRLPFLPREEWQIARRQRHWPGRFRSHLTAQTARARLGEDVWGRVAKISIVRNPFETAVSAYFWQRRRGESFTDFWQRNESRIGRNSYSYRIGEDDIIDFYLRFEAFDEDLVRLENRWPSLSGLADIFRSLSAKSGYRPKGRSVAKIFAEAPEIAAMVRKHCAFEIERFRYAIPDDRYQRA